MKRPASYVATVLATGLICCQAANSQSAAPTPAAQAPAQPAVSTKKAPLGTAVVKGVISELAGNKPLAEAIVVLTREGAADKLKFETEYDGKFEFTQLPAGNWTITVSAPNKFSHSEKFKLAAGEARSINVGMEELESVDTLKVSGKRNLIHAERIGNTTAVDRTFLDQYKSGNSLRDVIQSTPGIMVDTIGNIITRGEHNAVNYELDGAILPEAAGVLSQAQFANPRSLQSLTVDIGGYEAKDGGGPLGAVVRMKSLPIQAKPTLKVGGQLGGPIQGSLYYYASGALSQDKKSPWQRVRVESSGNAVPTCLGLSAPVKNFVRNDRLDLNFLNKIEFQKDTHNRFLLTAGINETFLQLPTNGTSRALGVGLAEHDREDYLVATYKRKGKRWIDEGDFHVINAFYSQTFRSTNMFDPFPVINGDEPQLVSVAPRATRRNYALSVQGNIKKTVFKTHHLQAGFLSEVRPVATKFGAIYRNANLFTTAQTQGDYQQAVQNAQSTAQNEFLAGISQQAFADATAAGATEEEAAAAAQLAAASAQNAALTAGAEAANAVPNTTIPYGAIINPYTFTTGGPQFSGKTGKYRGFRYLQSAYLQDTWRPQKGILKRLTLDAGVRADIYHGVFGNTMRVAQVIASIPDAPPFLLQPFQTQTVTNAQASGRFGGTITLTKNTLLRGSFSNLFQPPPVDVFSTPPNVADGTVNGIFNGTVRPLQATRGRLVDCGVETQVGPRFLCRNNFFYKQLKNFGDSGVVLNTPIYNRLSISAQEAYGLETRMDLKPARNGFGFNGFLSNTVAIAYLRGSKQVTGGIYEIEDRPILSKYPDHDRRLQTQAGLGYRWRNDMWCLAELGIMTGLQDQRSFDLFGFHPARTPVITQLGFNCGWKVPEKLREKRRYMPDSIDVRIQNILNQRIPLNLGSPFQGTRYQLPLQAVVGVSWHV